MTTAAITSIETANLGPVQAEYKVHQAKNRSNLIFGWLFIIVGPLALLISLIMTFASDTGGFNILCAGVGLLISLGGAFALWQYRRDTSINVSVHQGGLAYAHGGKTDVVRWDDVDSVKMDVVNVRMQGSRNAFDTIYGYVITPAAGAEIKFRFNKNSIPDIDQLSNTIQQEVTRRQLPKAAAILNGGGTVQFGKLSLNRTGVGNGKESVAWSDVEDLKLQNGVITVRKKGKWLNWSNVMVGQTPNVFVFLALANDVLKKQPNQV